MAEEEAQRGGRMYAEEDVETLLSETARRAATEAIKQSKKKSNEDGDEEDVIGFSPKLVKQLQTTVGVFNTLKDFASNPLQKAIEERVGSLAAGVIEQAFSRPSGPPPKRDIVDTILNSQFAFGLGNGLGQRAPELVETMTRSFGREKAEQFIDSAISSYGKTGSKGGIDGRQLPSQSAHAPSPPQEQQKDERQQTERELLLSLDPNNPEHVSAYAESQGGISVDVARKMLMIHQDEFINQMKKQGADVSQISTMRGSHTEKAEQHSQKKQVQPDTPIVQTNNQKNDYTDYEEINRENIEQEVPPAPPDSVSPTYPPNPVQNPIYPPNSPIQNPIYPQNPQPGPMIPPNTAFNNPPRPPLPSGVPIQTHQIKNQENEEAKQFTEDIVKIIGTMSERIENLGNALFNLQNELVSIKSQQVYTPNIPQIGQEKRSGEIDEEKSMEEIMGEIKPEKKKIKLRKSEDFFEEHLQSPEDFYKELEEESKSASEALNQSVIQHKKEEPIEMMRQATNIPNFQNNATEISNTPDIVKPQIENIQPATEEVSPIQENIQPATEEVLPIQENIHKEDNEENKHDKDVEHVTKRFVKPIKAAKKVMPSFKTTDQQTKQEET